MTSPLPSLDAAPAGRRLRPWILLAGLLAWAGLLFFAFPGTGGTETKWPWKVWLDSNRWFVRADLLLWAGSGALAIAVGLGLGRRGTSGERRVLGLLAALACFLEIRVHAQAGAFPLIAEEPRLDALKTFLPLAGLGAGLWVLASKEVRARRSAAGLVVLSALALVTMQLTTFPKGIGGQSLASRTVTKGIEFWQEVVGGGEVLEEVRTQFVRLLLGRVAPFASLVVAVVLALVAAGLARRSPTRGVRAVAAVALGFVVLRWAEPVTLQFVLDAQAIRAVGTTRVLRVFADALISAGFAAWLLVTVAGAAWMRAARAADTGPAPRAALPRSVAIGTRVVYALALALGVFSLFAALNPEWGTFAKAWPWEVARDLSWSQPVAALALFALFLSVLASSIGSKPGPARGYFAATAAVLALIAVGGPNPTLERPEESLYGVAPLIPPVLAALCAGGLLAAKAGGAGAARVRAVAVGAGACLLLTLVYPLNVEPKRYGGGLEYRSIVTVAATWPESGKDFFLGMEPGFGNPFVVFAHTGLAILALTAGLSRPVGAIRRAAAVAAIAVVWFWTSIAHPILLTQPRVTGEASPWDVALENGANPWNSVVSFSGQYLLAFSVPFAVALVAAMSDLSAPEPVPVPAPAPSRAPEPAPVS